MVKIRPATTEDSDALRLITVSASLSAFVGRVSEESLDLGWRPEDSAAGWRATTRKFSQDQFVLVAEIGQTVVSFVCAGLTDDRVTGEINGLYVLPTRHGHGIGRLLAANAVDRLKQRESITSLLIGCIRENPAYSFSTETSGSRGVPTTQHRRQIPHRGDLIRLVGPLALPTRQRQDRVTGQALPGSGRAQQQLPDQTGSPSGSHAPHHR